MRTDIATYLSTTVGVNRGKTKECRALDQNYGSLLFRRSGESEVRIFRSSFTNMPSIAGVACNIENENGFRKCLVAGWFSFAEGHATAGDVLVRELACEWLESAGYAYDVALAPPFEGGVDVRSVDARAYSHVVFVCGPFEQGELEATLLSRFSHCSLIGLNLSMTVPLNDWNPFDLLIERDSSVRSHPDMAFSSRQALVPVVGICLVEPHEGALDGVANAAIARLVSSRDMAIVHIDTRLDENSTGLRTAAEVESLIARMDAVITTRLHGTVLALKNGAPAIAIDPVPGGGKIRRQAQTIGWPIVFNADSLSDDTLRDALCYCLTERARTKARECAQRAVNTIEGIREAFIAALNNPDDLKRKSLTRIAAPVKSDWMTPFAQSQRTHSDENCGASRMPFTKRIECLLRLISGRRQ